MVPITSRWLSSSVAISINMSLRPGSSSARYWEKYRSAAASSPCGPPNCSSIRLARPGLHSDTRTEYCSRLLWANMVLSCGGWASKHIAACSHHGCLEAGGRQAMRVDASNVDDRVGRLPAMLENPGVTVGKARQHPCRMDVLGGTARLAGCASMPRQGWVRRM